MNLDGGIRLLNINRRLGDGSHVRAHFLTNPNGENQSSQLWIEGLGYVVGSH